MFLTKRGGAPTNVQCCFIEDVSKLKSTGKWSYVKRLRSPSQCLSIQWWGSSGVPVPKYCLRNCYVDRATSAGSTLHRPRTDQSAALQPIGIRTEKQTSNLELHYGQIETSSFLAVDSLDPKKYVRLEPSAEPVSPRSVLGRQSSHCNL
jgi:hypothetical protein